MPAIHTLRLHNSDNREEIKLDYQWLRKVVLIFRSVDHKARQQIIKVLTESQKLTVTEIYQKLRLEQSVTSQHLAILRRSGIVETSRDGKFVYYYLNKKRLEEISGLIKALSD